MPNYDMYCTKCKSEHKIWASIAEKTEKTIPCPSCGSLELDTLFKAPPGVVKGHGQPNCPSRCGGCPHAG